MTNIIISAITSAALILAALNVPASWLSVHKSNVFGTTLTTLNSGDTIANFPTTYNANLTAINNGKLEVSDYFGTTTHANITNLPALVAVSTLTTGVWNATPITFAYGGTGTSTLRFGGLVYGEGSYLTQASSTGLLDWNPTSRLLTAINASTTNFSIGTWLGIPNAADPTVAVAGTLALNTTAASTSVRYSDGSSEYALFDVVDVSFVYATSTPAGTTTIAIAGGKRKTTYVYGGCLSIGGTVNVQLGDYTASTTMLTSTQIASGATVPTFTTLSSNNTFNFGETRFIDIGTWSSTGIKQVNCTFGRQYVAD